MLFDEEISEDKGLFTFYREQAEREQLLKREKTLRKQLKKQLFPLNQPIFISPSKQLSPIKINTIRKVQSVNQDIKKLKPVIEKKRLIQSVVDMSRHIQDSQSHSFERKIVGLKMKESSFISKSRKYRQKINEFNQSLEHQKSNLQEQYISGEICVESLHRRNRSEDFAGGRIKGAIHTTRGSLELPDIRKIDEQKLHYKPKKSIKSKFLQQALANKDKGSIRDFGQNLNGRSFIEFQNYQEAIKDQQNYSYNNKTFQISQLHQRSMLFALKKIKKRA